MVQISEIKMFSAEDICRSLHIAKETAYAIMKAKEAGARYIGRKLLISEDKNDKIKVTKKGKIKTTNIGYFFDG